MQIIIKKINLGGLNFTSDSNDFVLRDKIYNLKIDDFSVRVMLIEKTLQDNNHILHRALYRELSDEQINNLEGVIKDETQHFIAELSL